MEITKPRQFRNDHETAFPYNLHVKGLTKQCFEFCLNICTVTFDGSVTAIPVSCFRGSGLKHIVIPEGVKTIGAKAFEHSEVVSITFPSTLRYIDEKAFHGCKYLKDVILPDGLKGLGTSCFAGCISLEKMVIPKSVKKLPRHLFRNCRSLIGLQIPDIMAREMKPWGYGRGYDVVYDFSFVEGCDSLYSVTVDEKEMILSHYERARRFNSQVLIEVVDKKNDTLSRTEKKLDKLTAVLGTLGFDVPEKSYDLEITLENLIERLKFAPPMMTRGGSEYMSAFAEFESLH